MQRPAFNQYPGCEPKIEENHSNISEHSYDLRTYILFFFTFSMIGWIWEVGLHFFVAGHFINRGVLRGPWLPIYGSGGVMILMLLQRFMDRPVLTFGLSMALCSTVEYVTSWFLEVNKGILWWDYSGYFVNLHGRICLESAIMFGLGGCIFIYLAAPMIAKFYQKIPLRTQTCLCVMCILFFTFDVGHSMFIQYPMKDVLPHMNRIELHEKLHWR